MSAGSVPGKKGLHHKAAEHGLVTLGLTFAGVAMGVPFMEYVHAGADSMSHVAWDGITNTLS